jgi:hypothetical protein
LRTGFTLCTATTGVRIRGADETSGSLFSYVDLEARIPPRHPLHKIRQHGHALCQKQYDLRRENDPRIVF